MTYRNRGLARLEKLNEARRTMERNAHGAALTLSVQQAPPEHADWHYDLRRKRLYIYGALLRYIDTAVRQGKPKDEVKMIPRWIEAYIDDQYDPTNTGELKLVA